MIATCRSGDGSDCWESTRKIAASTFLGIWYNKRARPRRRLQRVVELQKAMSCEHIAAEVSSEVGTGHAKMAGISVLFEIKNHEAKKYLPQTEKLLIFLAQCLSSGSFVLLTIHFLT